MSLRDENESHQGLKRKPAKMRDLSELQPEIPGEPQCKKQRKESQFSTFQNISTIGALSQKESALQESEPETHLSVITTSSHSTRKRRAPEL